jgi:hypothetical protein
MRVAGDGVVSQADYKGLQAIKHDLADPYGWLTDIGACSATRPESNASMTALSLKGFAA